MLVISVGDGNAANGVSVNVVRCIRFECDVGAVKFGIVGHDNGYTQAVTDPCVVDQEVDPELVTPHTEGLHAVVWDLPVSHAKL